MDEMATTFGARPQQRIAHEYSADHLPHVATGISHPDFRHVEERAIGIVQTLKTVVSLANERTPAWADLRHALDNSSTP